MSGLWLLVLTIWWMAGVLAWEERYTGLYSIPDPDHGSGKMPIENVYVQGPTFHASPLVSGCPIKGGKSKKAEVWKNCRDKDLKYTPISYNIITTYVIMCSSPMRQKGREREKNERNNPFHLRKRDRK